MRNEANICTIANSKIMNFPATVGIACIKGEIMVAGSLSTKGKHVDDIIYNKENGLDELADKLTILPKNNSGFSADLVCSASSSTFILKTTGLTCGIILSEETKMLLVAAQKEGLKNGNTFEKAVGNILEFLSISDLALIVCNNGSKNNALSYLKRFCQEFEKIVILDNFNKAQLLATGIFDLSSNTFGKNVNKLTGLNKLYFALGGSFTDKEFIAMLKSEKVETDNFIMEGLEFGLKISQKGINFYAQSTFKFKYSIKEERRLLDFTFKGVVSNASFSLSAFSQSRFPINDRLSFSDLGLTIGITTTGLSFGMIGRLNTNNLSLFGGFVLKQLGNTVRVSLLTSAITSTSGRITLKDLVREVADIQWDAVDCLDVIALKDFELKNATVGLKGDELAYPQMAPDEAIEDYEEKKKTFEKKVVDGFNKHLNEPLKIAGGYHLEQLGNNTRQYILTDTDTMRHFRIDNNGIVSLNCQIYLCYEAAQLGGYEMSEGMFICGTLELFGISVRFLFSIDKGLSLIALFQMQKVEVSNILTLSKSTKEMPFDPIDGGIAGQLLDKYNDGIDFYLCIQKNKGDMTFYLNAYISFLDIFKLDVLAFIKERFVYIDFSSVNEGFKVNIKIKCGLESFTTTLFEAKISFDTEIFLENIRKIQNEVRETAVSIKYKLEEAKSKIEEAQNEILKLESTIQDFNKKIDKCKKEKESYRWYQIIAKIAKEAEIIAYEVAKAGVKIAIGVAYESLELAKKVMDLGGKAVEEAFDAINYIINASVQLLWIKSLELTVSNEGNGFGIEGQLILTIFGKDCIFEGKIELDKIFENVKALVENSTDSGRKDIKESLNKGKFELECWDSIISPSLIEECRNIKACKETYHDMKNLRESMEELFLDTNETYLNSYYNESLGAREASCILEQCRNEEAIIRQQHCESFKEEYVKSLNKLGNKIKEEVAAHNVYYSDETLANIDLLEETVMELIEEGQADDFGFREIPTIYTRLEWMSDSYYKSRRYKDMKNEASAKEVNDKFVNGVENKINERLGDQNGEAAIQLKETLNQALKEFKEMNDTLE